MPNKDMLRIRGQLIRSSRDTFNTLETCESPLKISNEDIFPHPFRKPIEIGQKPLRSSVDLEDSSFSFHSSRQEVEPVQKHPAFIVKKNTEVRIKPIWEKFRNKMLTPEKLAESRLKARVRNSTIDQKKMREMGIWCLTLENYWKGKSQQKFKERLEIARNSAAFFYKNKNEIEEKLGGNETQLYRRTLYGLFQIDRNFKPKYTKKPDGSLKKLKNKKEMLTMLEKEASTPLNEISPQRKIMQQWKRIDPKDFLRYQRQKLSLIAKTPEISSISVSRREEYFA
jgi:hypothetical protein